MSFLNHKIPPPIVTITFIFLSFWLSGHLPKIEFGLQGISAIILICTGLSIGFVSLRLFNKHQTTFDPLNPEKATTLVTDGLFSVSRNPMYVGLLIILIGVCVYKGIYIGLIILPCFVMYITQFQIKPEEKAMSKTFGQEFIEYRKRVRRWI
ncbi:MAG: hypothetical protein CMO98_01170 [Woeseia sp.]|nr:hypothetical protein [Woeseia sp.]|tara:strand:- start:162 stop:617 length:456 start_codon:yes stop_codon:yes gene_type:complete